MKNWKKYHKFVQNYGDFQSFSGQKRITLALHGQKVETGKTENFQSVAKATLHSQMSVRLSVTKPLIQLNINHSILHHHYNNTPHPHFIFTTSYNCHSPSFKRLYFNTITSPLFFNHLTIIIHHPSIPYIIAMFSPSICQVSKV